MEYLSCGEVYHADLPVKVNVGYDFVKDYPMLIHSVLTQTSFNQLNLLPQVTWKVDSDKKFNDLNCESLVVQNKQNSIEVAATTTKGGETVCTACVSLQFNQHLLKVMNVSISKDYGRLPNALCPAFIVDSRISNLRHTIDELHLTGRNQERKISTLTRRHDDNSRLMVLFQERDVPAIKRLALVHFRCKKSVSSFFSKRVRAADTKMVGHTTYQRTFPRLCCWSRDIQNSPHDNPHEQTWLQ